MSDDVVEDLILEVIYHGGSNIPPIDIIVPSKVQTVENLKCLLDTNDLFNASTETILFKVNSDSVRARSYSDHTDLDELDDFNCVYIFQRNNDAPDDQSSRLIEESDRKYNELRSQISSLNPGFNYQMMALRDEMKIAMDSMKTMVKENNDLRQQLLTSENSKQEVVRNFSELSAKNSALSEEMSALKARNESEVKTLRADLKIAMDSMNTMIKENNDLRQQLLTINTSNENMAKELTQIKHKLCQMSTNTIESDVKQLEKDIKYLNIRCPASDSSSSSSPIGSHN